MPKQTFLNLDEGKRKKIIKSALNEFSEKGFQDASVNRIVSGAEIPKGSFYQYFIDKKDIFSYICSLAAKEKFEYIVRALEKADEMNFFEMFKEMYVEGIRFGKEHPEYFCISNELVKDTGLRKEIFGEQYERAEEFFLDFLKAGVERGDIKKGFDIRFVSRLITSSSIALSEYFIEKHSIDDIAKIKEDADEYIEILKYGIAGGQEDGKG